MLSRASAATRNLALATIALTICFTSWGLVAPLAKQLQESRGWSDTQVLLLAAVPVLCGSILRVPAGRLADRYGGRRIFTLIMLASIVPAIALLVVPRRPHAAARLKWRRGRLADPGRLAVLAARPRLEHPAAVHRPAVHPLPAPVGAGPATALIRARRCS
jgi:MFS family permease